MRYGSVCSGIEAASIAWEPLGWQPAWFAEIEPFPSAVLAHHWPQVPNLGDMTSIAANVTSGDAEAPDILVGGTPCQAFSVAGLRCGLSDARGQLTLSYVELANAIDSKRREENKPEAIVVWENVPGVLSDKTNAFGCFLAGLAGEDEELHPSGKRWPNAGCVYGPERTIAWRVLDAQYFGVAQRRRRVFVVASARDGFDPTKVLFELDSVRRDTPPRREAGSRVAALTSSGVGTCGADDNQAQAGHLIPQIVGALDTECGFSKATEQSVRNGHLLPVKAFRQTAFGEYADDETASTCCARDYKDATDLAVAFNWQAGGKTSSTLGAGEITGALQASQHPAVLTEPYTIAVRGRVEGSTVEVRNDGTSNALLTPNGGRAGIGVGAIGWGMQVRRLMVTECERLQGLPDNHTLISWKGKAAVDCPDGPRYKAVGNSMAVPVMNWIGRRIARECELSNKDNEVLVVEKIKTSQYCSDLAVQRLADTHYLKDVGDQWRTPDALFWGINAMFGPLVLDLFSDGENSKCPNFYTAEVNALTQNWSEKLSELNGAAFGNPPYSRAKQHEGQYVTGMSHIMRHTAEMRDAGGRYVFLIKVATSESWWPEDADHVAFIRGRVGFDLPLWFNPADEKQVPTGAFFAGAIAVFDKTWRGPATSYIQLERLLSQGEAFIDQIRREAERLRAVA